MPSNSFERYGKNITELLTKYPITNHVWHIYGEEFITSAEEVKGDDILLDPWSRIFPNPTLETVKTVEKPSRHTKIFTTVVGVKYVCNVFMLPLWKVMIDCNVCVGVDRCIECNKTGRKMIYYPKGTVFGTVFDL